MKLYEVIGYSTGMDTETCEEYFSNLAEARRAFSQCKKDTAFYSAKLSWLTTANLTPMALVLALANSKGWIGQYVIIEEFNR